MLSDKAVTLVTALSYRADADWEVNLLPFGSIYWTDEMPAIRDIFDKPADMSVISSMFAIRMKLWDGVALTEEDQGLWDAVRRQVPHWALFKRLTLSDEQKLARAKAEQLVEQEFESLSSDEADPA